MPEESFGHDQLKDCITQKLEALIVERIALSLVPNARMRHGFFEQTRIAKPVTDSLFQRAHLSASGKLRAK
jgi:hypothetical protein